MTVIRVKGFDGLDKALQQLSHSVRADVLERVATESADPMRADYAQGAPEVVQRNVHVRTADKRPNTVWVAVGSRHPLAHIFEFGTRARRTKSGAGRGRIEKQGFARRAFDVNVERWFTGVGRLLWREVKRVGR